MNADSFIAIAERLSGTPVKDVTPQDRECLDGILADDDRAIRFSQFNELLLLVNKDRVSQCFFQHFFGESCAIGALSEGVHKFQKTAMLCFGNFIFAFRRLAKADSMEELRAEIVEHCEEADVCTAKFAARSPKLLNVELIPKVDTPLVGYLSAGEIVAELGRWRHLRDRLPTVDLRAGTTWENYQAQVVQGIHESELAAVSSLLARLRLRFPDASLVVMGERIAGAVEQLEQREVRLEQVRRIATKNQDVYLTWDHMDIYFATSMRKRWEYEDLFDFIQGVMSRPGLADLNLRYFDPTQAFTANRVNKGLVEALMLKRAKCTVYSVQDTDTLGKDSELAATLAQGKTVIAYVPQIVADARRAVLLNEEPATIQERLRFVLYADDKFATTVTAEDLTFVRGFNQLEAFEAARVWRSLPDDERVAEFRNTYQVQLHRLCGIIAEAERRIYERRAQTLKSTHPLAIQVNLATGVANGVLVVRSVEDCARLIRQIVTKSLEFDLDEPANDPMIYLRERISGCPFRVVTKDRKLTNCFWNFYRASAR